MGSLSAADAFAAGLTAYRSGRLAEAESLFRKSLADDPAHPDSLHLLGLVAYGQGRADGALALIDRAVAVLPEKADFHSNKCAILKSAGRASEAVAAASRALALRPDSALAYNNLGLALGMTGEMAEAEASFRNAISLEPALPEAFNNLGRQLVAQGEGETAKNYYARAVTIRPDFGEAHNNFGILFHEGVNFDLAVACYRNALVVRPDDPDALNNLGAALQEHGRVDEAIPALVRTVACHPGDPIAGMNLIFAQHYRQGVAPAEILAMARHWAASHAVPPAIDSSPAAMPERARRIGFVSADFRQHAVGFLALPAVEALSRAGYEIHCYSNSLRSDAMTERFRAAATVWRDIYGLPIDSVAERIRADGIHILFDLSGFSGQNSLLAFAAHPAPVQVAWLGYPGTTGMAAMDYILADRHQIPPGSEMFYSEAPVRLPDSYVLWGAPDSCPAISPLPALANDFVTFGSFNALKKVSPTVIAQWARILNRVPGSRLLMKTPVLSNPGTRQRVEVLFARHGVTADRLNFAGSSTVTVHQETMAKADIALDSFPYTGGLTTLECLWMGLPVVSISGGTFCSRHSLGYLTTAGLSHLVAADDDAYVDLAVDLASDLPRLARLRAGLRQQVANSPLCDRDRFLTNFERALQAMWDRWRKGLAPTCIDIEVPSAKGAAASGVELDEKATAALFHQAVACHQAGRVDEAADLYRRVIDANPTHAEAWNLLGVVAFKAGRLDNAAFCFLHALVLRPDFSEAHNNLGLLRHRQGVTDEALVWLRRAEVLQPDNTEFTRQLQAILRGGAAASGAESQQAVAFFRQAEQCEREGRLSQAEALYRAVIRLSPELPEPYNNLGVLFHRRGWLTQATGCFVRALALKPDLAEVWNNQGLVFRDRARPDNAVPCFHGAVALKPQMPTFHNNLGETLLFGGAQEQATHCFDRALLLDPGSPTAGSNGVMSRLYHADTTLAELLALSRQWAGRNPATSVMLHGRRPFSARPRLGFVSGDFRAHAVGFLVLPALEALVRAGYSVTCYGNNAKEDSLTDRFRQAASRWRTIAGQSDEAVGRQIVADGIDILFDLSGHTAHNRLRLFAGKPAPLQVAWIGYPATTGLDAIDYILADRHQIPEGAEAFYSEKAIRLPDSYVVFGPPDGGPLPALPAEKNGRVTFGAFHGARKLSPQTVALWSRVLARVPGSRLLLKAPAFDSPGPRERVRALFAGHGIAADRLAFRGATSPDEHRAAMAEADIGLDSVPYSGGQTTLEALWMGLPVITCPGDTFASRHSLGYLRTAGLGQMVAEDLDEYVDRAVSLASDLPALAALRASMRRRLLASPLCDVDRFIGHLDRTLLTIWQRWCDGLSAETIDVAALSAPRALTSAADTGRARDAAEGLVWHLFERARDTHRTGRSAEAIALYRQVLCLVPGHADALNLLGMAILDHDDPAAAAVLIDRAAHVDDRSSLYVANLGNVYRRLGRPDAAAALYRRGLALDPANVGILCNLATLYGEQGQGRAALPLFQRALAMSPDSVNTYNNLGNLLQDMDRQEGAAACLQRALALDPANAVVYQNLGVPFQELCRTDEALASFHRALRLRPNFGVAHMNLVFTWLYQPGVTLAALFDEARRWGERQGAVPAMRSHAPPSVQRLPRIGFVSADFRNHAVGLLTIPAVEALHRRGYSIVCYSNGGSEDHITARFRRASATWRTIHGLPDALVAEQIAADGIDILFDLTGYTSQGRLPVFARRPAPLQVTWAGFPATTGVDAIDYILADRHQIPPGAEVFYSEKVIRLPDSYVAFQPSAGTPPLTALPAERHGFITFGSFNGLKKIGPHVVAAWGRILNQVPNSRLLMKAPALGGDEAQQRYRQMFAEHGILADRLRFIGKTTTHNHMVAMVETDIGLDSFPYSGGQTTLECLWMGLPVVTCPGETFASRHSLGYLTTAGLSELVAADLDHYVELAVGLANNVPRLATMRAGMRQRLLASPLGDVERFADHLEDALLGIWRRWCSGQSAATIDVPLKLNADAHALHRKAVICHETGRVAEAAALYRKVIELQADHADAMHLLGVATLQLGHPSEALGLIDRAVAARPGEAAYHSNRASILMTLGQPGAAIEAARRALRLDMAHSAAWTNLANAERACGQSVEAGQLYQRAVTLDPAQPQAYRNLAALCAAAGRSVEAVALFRRSVWLAPLNADVHNDLALVHQTRGEPNPAEVCLRRALALDPVMAVAWNNLGLVRQSQGDVGEAVAFLGRAVALAPDNASFAGNLAEALHPSGRLDEATDCRHRALALDS